MKQLKPQHQVFINEYLTNGYNMTQAYMVAYPDASYATASRNGHRLMKTQRIKDAVAQEIELRVGTKEELKRKITLKLAEMAFSSKDDENYPYAAQTKALDMLNKMSGNYTEKIEVTNRTITITFEDDNDESDGD